MRRCMIAISLACLVAVPAQAASRRDAVDMRGAAAIEPLLKCRAITEPAQRLSCFDTATSALQTAVDQRDVVVVDKAEVRKARQSLFGFNLPSLRIFDADRDAGRRDRPAGLDDEQDEITSTIQSARQDRDGYWLVTLDTGAVWHQTGGEIVVPPRKGGQVTIRRAALGSYFLRIGKAPGVKARREG